MSCPNRQRLGPCPRLFSHLRCPKITSNCLGRAKGRAKVSQTRTESAVQASLALDNSPALLAPAASERTDCADDEQHPNESQRRTEYSTNEPGSAKVQLDKARCLW